MLLRQFQLFNAKYITRDILQKSAHHYLQYYKVLCNIFYTPGSVCFTNSVGTRHFILKICETIQAGIQSNYLNTRILFGVPKNPSTEDYSVLRKSEYQIWILLFGPTIRIVFEYRIIRYTLTNTMHSSLIHRLRENFTQFDRAKQETGRRFFAVCTTVLWTTLVFFYRALYCREYALRKLGQDTKPGLINL